MFPPRKIVSRNTMMGDAEKSSLGTSQTEPTDYPKNTCQILEETHAFYML